MEEEGRRHTRDRLRWRHEVVEEGVRGDGTTQASGSVSLHRQWRCGLGIIQTTKTARDDPRSHEVHGGGFIASGVVDGNAEAEVAASEDGGLHADEREGDAIAMGVIVEKECVRGPMWVRWHWST